MARIEFKNDVTRATEETEGSDGRLNVSSRVDGRAYYISRDQGQCYSMSFEHTTAGDGEYSFYLQNTSTDKELVVAIVDLNCTNISRFKLWEVTGTAANGAARVPKNTNLTSSNDAAASTALHDGGGTTISGLSTSGIELFDKQMEANTNLMVDVHDIVRLGQSDAIALEMDTGTSTPNVFGEVIFFYE